MRWRRSRPRAARRAGRGRWPRAARVPPRAPRRCAGHRRVSPASPATGWVGWRSLTEDAVHLAEELGGLEGLRQVPARAEAQALLDLFLLRLGGEEHEGDVGAATADLRQRLDAAHLGHHP